MDPATRQLWRDGERVALPLKSFDCLTYLIEHRDRAVGRDELVAAVWGRVEVSDKLLGQTLLRARRAIGDAGGEHASIRTLPRFGYHWEEPVEIEMPIVEPATRTPAPEANGLEPPVAAAPPGPIAVEAPSPAAPPHSRTRISRRVKFAVAALLLLALGAAALVHRWPARPADAPASQEGHLVLVLPVSGAGSGEESWIRLGAMDYLASRLRKANGLHVLPSEQTVALLGHDSTADQRGESDLHRFEQMTGASYILAPRIAHSGDSWNATLDVYHDRGTQSFEAQAAAPLQAMAQVANRFVEKIGLSPGEAPEPPSSPTETLQRIDAALLAGDLEQARALTEAAPAESRRDPAFVIRAARIAFRSGEIDQAERSLQPLDREDAAVPAEVRAQAALGLGGIAVYRQDFAAAERRYGEAITALGEAGAPMLLGKAYMERGVVRGVSQRFDEAMADFGRARVQLELAGDRLGGANLDTNLGLVETLRNRYSEAAAAYERAVAAFARFGVNDNLAIALQGQAYVQRMLVNLDAAQASSERMAGLAEHLRNPLLLRRMALSRAQVMLDRGQLGEASSLVQRHLSGADGSGEDPVFAVLRARVLIEQGRSAEALADADRELDAMERQDSPNSEMYLSEAAGIYVDAALRSDDSARAERFLQRLKHSRQVPQDDARAFIEELATARIAAARGDADAAAHFAKAMALAENRAPRDRVTAGCAFADFLLARKATQDATAVLGRLVPYADRDYDAARTVARLYAALGNDELAGRAQADARRLAGERSR
ncbi:winged helix-turn-helix domain-containing protein [Dokdonella sp.]|uniref:winged helix-turn-helix domain-containing protein n=1 Tax=Dokdonella sp. TaxID=2291710 RepID=UPI001B13E150|nr:winged helix-turn-helix domain-containing protein [Dokdonella sp.]MBO9663703.1 winged helix-turn-helix domain-containing protein [Dokdonella sp.]